MSERHSAAEHPPVHRGAKTETPQIARGRFAPSWVRLLLHEGHAVCGLFARPVVDRTLLPGQTRPSSERRGLRQDSPKRIPLPWRLGSASPTLNAAPASSRGTYNRVWPSGGLRLPCPPLRCSSRLRPLLRP